MVVVSIRLTKDAELLIIDDCRVVCVDEDYLEEFVLTIFAYPIGIENLKIREVASNTLFGDTLCVFCHGDFGNTGLGWFSLHVDFALTKPTASYSGTD